MNFNDLFKSSFLENITSFSALDMVIAMGLAFVLGLFIFFVYKKTYTGVMYSSGFGVSLLGLTLVTTLIILAVTSNIILSLGMVGALSIVRFRTAIKEPLDIVFLFWSIAAGIVLGAGLLPLAMLGSLFIGVILVVFVNKKSVDSPYILIVESESSQPENDILNIIKAGVKRYSLKSKTISDSGMEFTLEVRLTGNSTRFMGEIKAISQVKSTALVSYNGDYMS
ncbi:MAG: DUF4956 domain-containing protein [Lacrimispora sp.]|uniref:DUF4956 domain-containing protein n=1 Tax=Lacrimispora sp. TaxID=2719234 RepID=UPI0039E414C9